jgi:eukaryotic-like serine/threonine-protein kinase
MAPEQIEAHPRSASDQYSLGIVAYEWLCGTRPFHGSYTEIAIKHSVIPPPSLRSHLFTLSPDIEHVVLTALAKRPEERFSSVSAFVTALEQASQDRLPTEQLYPEGLLPSMPTPLLKQSAEPLATITKNSNPFVPRPIIQTSPALPKQPVPEKTTSKPAVSRRALIIGAAGVACAAAGGGASRFYNNILSSHLYLFIIPILLILLH